MVERDDLVATYSVDYVAGVMSLRKPQKESLIRLEKIWNAADIRKDAFAGAADGSIKKYVFNGAKKGVFGEFKVDSKPELAFARMIDTDPVVSNWLRPAVRQFELVYNGAHQYEPDFVVETESDIYLVEIKRHDQVEDDDVKAKRARAVTYCQKVTTWAEANGYKPWTHLFISDNEVRTERLLADYVKMFTVKEG